MADQGIRQKLQHIFDQLMACYGPQHWWPAQEPFEVILGAILTQSAAWSNVDKAISNLRTAGALSPQSLLRMPLSEIARLIHPCGYYNAKARKLKSFVEWLDEHYSNSPGKLFANGIAELRRQLLSVYGIGEETADSIILYAANKPIFVIDAYTRRILSRTGIAPESNSYSSYQALFMKNLPADAQLFNEYHALLVRLGKSICRPRPLCLQCCLNDFCRAYKKGVFASG